MGPPTEPQTVSKSLRKWNAGLVVNGSRACGRYPIIVETLPWNRGPIGLGPNDTEVALPDSAS